MIHLAKSLPFSNKLAAVIGRDQALTIGRNSLVHATELGLNTTIGLVITLMIARTYGPEQFGLWSLGVSMIQILLSIVKFGSDLFVLKSCSDENENHAEVLAHVITLRSIIGVICCLLVAGTILLTPIKDQPLGKLLLLMCPILLFIPLESIEFFFRAQKNAVIPAIARVTSIIIGSSVKLLTIIMGVSIIYLGFGHLLQLGLVGAFLLGFYYSRGYRLSMGQFPTAKINRLLKVCWPLLVSTLGLLIFSRSDLLMIAYFKGNETAGYYAAASRITEIITIAPYILVTVFSPFLFDLYRSKVQKFREFYQLFLTWIFVALVLIALAISLSASWIIFILFGSDYAPAVSILVIHIWGIVFFAQGAATECYWIARKRSRIIMYRSLVGASINIILNFMLIPKFGAIGAAFATIMSYMFAFTLIHLFLNRSGRYLFLLQTSAIRFR